MASMKYSSQLMPVKSRPHRYDFAITFIVVLKSLRLIYKCSKKCYVLEALFTMCLVVTCLVDTSLWSVVFGIVFHNFSLCSMEPYSIMLIGEDNNFFHGKY